MNGVYISVALYSIVFAQRRLSREGVSRKMRKLFFFKHLFYVVWFIIAGLLEFVQISFHQLNKKDFEKISEF